jgi:LPPG:FO 2-phospho-L-lactate transferase
MKVTALAGGVGGAKLVDGLAQILPPEDLTVIVNTGDDFEHFGLYICPDIDTICYTLAGLANPTSGWGRCDETWFVMESIKSVDGPSWFNLGDKDLGTHLERTRLFSQGQKLSTIVRNFCKIWGIGPTVLPMSDDKISTIVTTEDGDLPFQEYFVKNQCKPRVKGFRFEGVNTSSPTDGILSALKDSDLAVICPSNPFVSIDPILKVPNILDEILHQKQGGLIVIGVSPIIGGQAVKGPAAKMFKEMGIEPSAYSVAVHYKNLIDGFIYDSIDSKLDQEMVGLGLKTLSCQTLMKTSSDRKMLAMKLLDLFSVIDK